MKKGKGWHGDTDRHREAIVRANQKKAQKKNMTIASLFSKIGVQAGELRMSKEYIRLFLGGRK